MTDINAIYAGLDVHKDSITVAAARGDKEVLYLGDFRTLPRGSTSCSRGSNPMAR